MSRSLSFLLYYSRGAAQACCNFAVVVPSRSLRQRSMIGDVWGGAPPIICGTTSGDRQVGDFVTMQRAPVVRVPVCCCFCDVVHLRPSCPCD
jgi:hypothetical protein